MKLSFLIPSKNRLELLGHCLQSIRAQKGDAEIEIIVSDNASTEDYRSYIEQIADPRIIYIRQSDPVPVTDNWRAALSCATGEYVLMLGDDDALAPTFMETVVPYASDGADILYLRAYHYCYPDVIPESPAGYLAVIGCEFLPSDNGAFCLLPHYARELADSVFEFRHRFGFNAQHFLLKRSFIDRLAETGSIYQSPYPDFFAAIVSFKRAQSIIVIPEPSVIIGISPRSFGAFYFSSRHDEGYKFLANEEIDPKVHSVLEKVIVPGDRHNTNWLVAAETARRVLGCSRRIDLNRYTLIQLLAILRSKFLKGRPSDPAIEELRSKVSGMGLLELDCIVAAVGAAAGYGDQVTAELLRAIERQIGQYPTAPVSMIEIGIHHTIADAFDWLAGTPEMREAKLRAKEAFLKEREVALRAKELAAQEAARRANPIRKRLLRRVRVLNARLFGAFRQ
jgi:glycosyltransferase involved in cell wall biosynthesis